MQRDRSSFDQAADTVNSFAGTVVAGIAADYTDSGIVRCIAAAGIAVVDTAADFAADLVSAGQAVDFAPDY